MCVVYTCEMQGLPVDSCNVKDTANSMDVSSYRLNFDLGKENEIHHYS